MTLTKIVITGGPSGGKTTAMSWIQNAFTRLGYTVLFVPETATELITGGVAPWTCGTNLDFQKCQMRLQLEKERIFEEAARSMKADKLLLVCDRGALDNKSYMNDEEFAAVQEYVHCSEAEMLAGYDAVFHLVTAAKGAEEFYTFANNAARYETVSQAVALDDRLIEAWSAHPRHTIIDNSVELREKLKRLIAAIRSFLGEPEPSEIERKFLVSYPDLEKLAALPGCRRVEIEQAYLPSVSDEELRIRKWVEDGKSIYYKTRKRRVNGKRLEMEERLSQKTYQHLLEQAGWSEPLHKTRYSLSYRDQLFQLDVYPFWQDKAVVKTEVDGAETEVVLPPELQLIREVTGEPAFKDRALAKAHGI
ncbi:MAG: AAA family ATPase [Oscillospiraceae bacterium]|nr:AAA family ATPase [Oscillospiraceae bacterium]